MNTYTLGITFIWLPQQFPFFDCYQNLAWLPPRLPICSRNPKHPITRSWSHSSGCPSNFISFVFIRPPHGCHHTYPFFPGYPKHSITMDTHILSITIVILLQTFYSPMALETLPWLQLCLPHYSSISKHPIAMGNYMCSIATFLLLRHL